MIETSQWQGTQEIVTVEFTPEEFLAALAAYAGIPRRDDVPRYATFHEGTEPGKNTVTLTYFRRQEKARP